MSPSKAIIFHCSRAVQCPIPQMYNDIKILFACYYCKERIKFGFPRKAMNVTLPRRTKRPTTVNRFLKDADPWRQTWSRHVKEDGPSREVAHEEENGKTEQRPWFAFSHPRQRPSPYRSWKKVCTVLYGVPPRLATTTNGRHLSSRSRR
ncbi:hypothetical protein GHT06_010068 [Daphnia sinensis]|uniref:Uncharacterized protein n=1 Tax=Daphnia sinensis TaxID=1820382 RepID=A0AAD5KZR7_9CRUS|nr:hypothetical protein GHT06_010068 [Daphnia sinensis]